LAAAWLAGCLIGAERSFHGRAAGFRTHALVAIAAAAAMLLAFAPSFAPAADFPIETPRFDPTRLAQGVLTGIGFLGAGVIFKEGVNVQGLTTAASVWATAVVGLLFGLGEYAAGAATTVAVLVTLLVLRWVEDIFPVGVYAWAVFRFHAAKAPDRAGLNDLLAGHGVSLRDLSYALSQAGAVLELRGNIAAASDSTLDTLAAGLRAQDGLIEFELSRISK
jgi:putative Mg2+ transporter-C (MgtC) family protein